MTQLAINMHTSQVAHGKIPAADYDAAGVNVVRVGYTVSMVHLHLYLTGDPVAQLYWYSHEPDVVMVYEHGQAPAEAGNDVLEVGEKEFSLDGTNIDLLLNGTADEVRWQVDGCHNDDNYRHDMNPAPVNAGTSMDAIVPHLPELNFLSSETDIEVYSMSAESVTDIDNTALTMTVAATTTVDQMIADIQATDGSTQTYNVYEDETGSPNLAAEKTGATALVTGDWLVVTAEDGSTYADYVITVSA